MATLIVEDVFAEMESLIGGIVAGERASNGSAGFHHTWKSVNLFDAGQHKPGANADMFLLTENPLDESGDNQGGLMGQWMYVEIHAFFLYANPPANPIRQGQIDLWKCQDDLKRLFGREHSVGDSGAFDILRNGQARIEYNQIDSRPGKLISPWKVEYWQQRENPDLKG